MITELAIVPALSITAAVLAGWRREAIRHQRRLDRLPLRIHVNGTRGKSTVTRIVAGLLREAGIDTVAKCTGTAAAVIFPDGSEARLRRRGAPTILEQIDVIRQHVTDSTAALVVECMALRPNNQQVSEERIVQSTIGIMTNVREDHQDVMGETLPEIAASLMNTCPRDGVLLTAETNPEVLRVMERIAAHHRTTLEVVTSEEVTDDDIRGFDYFAFKENVALGLALAQRLNIPRDVAMRGMQRAAPDPGVLRLRHVRLGSKRVTWANLFAVNDRESVITAVERLQRERTSETTVVGVLNNRSDREQRAVQFAEIAANDLALDRIALLGAYEPVIARLLTSQLDVSTDQIIRAGEQRQMSLGTLLERLVHDQPSDHVLLLGLVNIHTPQAEALQAYLEGAHHAH